MHFAAETQEGASWSIGQTCIRSQKHVPCVHHEPREDKAHHGHPDQLLHCDGETHPQYAVSLAWVVQQWFILLLVDAWARPSVLCSWRLHFQTPGTNQDCLCGFVVLGCYMVRVLELELWEGRFVLSSVVGLEYYSPSHWRPWERRPLITAVCNTHFYSQLSCPPLFPPPLQAHPLFHNPSSHFFPRSPRTNMTTSIIASIHHCFTDLW